MAYRFRVDGCGTTNRLYFQLHLGINTKERHFVYLKIGMSSSDTTKMTQDSKKHGGGSHRNQLPPMSTTSADGQPPSSGPNDIEHLKNELEREKKNRFI